jgi:hypothetical protein
MIHLEKSLTRNLVAEQILVKQKKKKNLWDRLKDLARRCFVCTVYQVRKAVLIFAKNRSVKHPVGK